MRIEVDWRDGRHSVVDSAAPNRLYEISEGAVAAAHPAARAATLFQDVSEQLAGHRHVEPYFDDYARQPLLPNSFSQLGPGIAWADVGGDGKEDLFVGAGRSGSLAWFHNDGTRLRHAPLLASSAPGDLTTILGWPDGHGGQELLVGVSNYEVTNPAQAAGLPAAFTVAPKTGAIAAVVPGDNASVGALAAADYDGDGTLDLFMGGRIGPGIYPQSPSSRLFLSRGGRLVADSVNNELLRDIGMVSAALFSDIDGDGDPDLLVAIEWGTIRVFVNAHGRFHPATFPGLTGLYSRWNGLATGDLDGDGRLDIVATSWGRNTGFGASDSAPLFLYFAGPVLAQRDARINAVAPLVSFPRLIAAIPAIGRRIRTFSAYADAGIDQVLGPAGGDTPRLGATTLDHYLFLNRGNRFEARVLPLTAQMAPAFYAGIADFNGDGKEDLFLSQNFFATEPVTPRFDAGRSLLLLGDGSGGLEAMPGQQSGLIIYGEQRGAGYADFDGDGRLDFVVSQNGEATRLFHNVGATPGLRVRIIGPQGNPTGVGTQMRLRYGDAAGPVREVQAGSGYWSENGAIQVLGGGGNPTALWVRWPGGREQVMPLTSVQREITIHP